MPHPPHSPDLTPSNNFLFVSWMKKFLKGKCFANMEVVKQKTAEALKDIKINEFSPGWCGSVG